MNVQFLQTKCGSFRSADTEMQQLGRGGRYARTSTGTDYGQLAMVTHAAKNAAKHNYDFHVVQSEQRTDISKRVAAGMARRSTAVDFSRGSHTVPVITQLRIRMVSFTGSLRTCSPSKMRPDS